MPYQVSGVTRNNAGATLGSCKCYLFKHNGQWPGTLTLQDITISDAGTGAYTLDAPDGDPFYAVIARKEGTPNVMDVTAFTLVPELIAGITGPTLDLTTDTGDNTADNITNLTALEIDIIFTNIPLTGDVIKIRDGTTVIYEHTITSTESGNTVIPWDEILGHGPHVLQAQHTNWMGTSDWGPILTITVDTTVPIISSPAGAELTAVTADLDITTDHADGNIWWVVTASATQPTKVQIKAGQDHTGAVALAHDFIAVSASGAQTDVATGLNTAGTRFAHFFHEDVAGNQSNIATSSGWSQTGSGYSAVAVRFDGTNDFMQRGAGLDGAADGTGGTLVLWLNMKGGDGALQLIWSSENARVTLERTTANKLRLFTRTTGGGTLKECLTTSTYTASTGWKCIMISWQSGTGAGDLQIYEGDNSVRDTPATNTTGTQDFTLTNWIFAGNITGPGQNKLNAEVADARMWTSRVDLSVESNRRKFINALGTPVNPTDAETAFGEPIVEFKNALASWHTNTGSGGGFTLTGTLEAGTPP